MQIGSFSKFSIIALALASAFGVSGVAGAQTTLSEPLSPAAQRALSQPLSKSQQTAAAQKGTQLGDEGLTDAKDKTLNRQEGGPKGAGCTMVSGKCVDNEEMMGRGYDQSRVDRAGTVDGKMSSLKQFHEEESYRTTTDDGAIGAAYKTSEESADRKVLGIRELGKTDWSQTIGAIQQGRDGNAAGMGFEQCTTTTTVIPGTNPDAYIKEQHVCEIVNTPGADGGLVCTRERIPTPSQEMVENSTERYLGTPGGISESFCTRTTGLEAYPLTRDFAKSGFLEITTESGGLSCTRNRWAVLVDTVYGKEKTASLGINTESGGLSCSRFIEPSNTSDLLPQSRTVDLPVDNQAGGNLCKRLVWPTSTTTPTAGSKTASLNVNGETGGLSCTRKVWPTSGTNVTGVSHDATLLVDKQTGGNLCVREVWPTAGTGSSVNSQAATLNINNESPGLICTRMINPNTTTATTPGVKDVVASVNNEVGGLSCNRWRTVAVNYGAAVTTPTYTFTKPTRFNHGTGPWTTVTSLAAQVPAGTTELTNFQIHWTSSNGDTISRAITVYPSAANGWSVSVQTDGECWFQDNCNTQPLNESLEELFLQSIGIGTAQAAPCIEWYCDTAANQAYFTFTPKLAAKSFNVVESGNCGDTGTTLCPSVWSCNTQAPTAIAGIPVTAAEVGALGALYPGAPSACTYSTKARTCGGTATTSNNFYIGDRLAAGTTTISLFKATIQNPQTGITNVITQVPSAANGWIAIVRIDRTNYSYSPSPVQLRLTWNQTASTSTPAVVDSGDCNGGGTASCPAQWSCLRNASYSTPTGTLTTAIASQFSPLYPGATSTICGTAEKRRVCAGNPAVSNAISIAPSLPPGTTSISNFAFTVSNPQTGVVVSLVTAPTAANGWTATFNVTRSDFTTQKVGPQINMTWNSNFGTVNVSTKDTGNCAASGSPNCPASWSCTKSAPTTINGISVTTAMAAGVAPLFAGAANTCATGQLNKTCSGTASQTTSIDLSGRMPAGTTTITNFAFSILNPQTGVAVVLTQAPTLANGWIAKYRVDRTYFAAVPIDPNIRMTWNASVPITNVSVQDTGSCSDPGSVTCPTTWSCANSAPFTVNGISVTSAMAATQAPLFPGAASSCVVGNLSRTCSGSSTVGTNISIADQIPAGVSSITNFGFTVQNPQAGITVTLVTAPSQANGWMSSFNVTRSGVLAAPQPPQVTVSWNMGVPGVNVTVQDTGNCSASGTAQCPAVWSCKRNAPTTINGISVTSAMTGQVSPLFPGAAAICAEGSLDKTCSGSGNTQLDVSIASQLPAGTTTIQDFGWVVNNPQSGVSVTLTQTPAAANSWLAKFQVARTDFSTPKVSPNVTMTWTSVVPTVTLTINESGSCADPGSTSCPTQWQCVSSAPMSVNGINITAAMAATKAPLFGGAPTACIRGDLSRVCAGSAVVGTTVGIGELIPAGVNVIQNFAFTVTNPQTGVTVSLVTPPTLANGWTASFNVARTNWSQTPVAPQVKVTFEVVVPEPSLTIQDTGDCSDPGSQACPTSWQCTNSAPTTINGIPVTVDMVDSLPLLFPSSSTVCVAANLSRVCGGSSAAQSSISIADQIAPATTAIEDFAWTWANQDAALTVSLVSAPTQANGWLATFSVNRNYSGGATPAKPQINLTWKVTTTEHRAVVTESGDCSVRTAYAAPVDQGPSMLALAGEMALDFVISTAHAMQYEICDDPEQEDGACGGNGPGGGQLPPGETPPDDEPPPSPPAAGACEVKWECKRSIPGEIAGIPVTQAILDERGPLFEGDGPPAACLEAEYKRICADGGASGSTEISIAAFLEPGTQEIFNYTWTLIEPGAGVTVSSTQVPALSNNWVAKFAVVRSNFSIPAVSPKVKLTWNSPGEVQWDFPIEETGDCNGGVEDEFCKTEWTCEDQAPEPTRPVKVCEHITTPWYNGAVATNPGDTAQKTFNLQSFIKANTQYVTRFKYEVQTNVGGCQIGLTPFPPLPTAMTVNQVTTATIAGTECKPLIRFEWDNLCPDDSWTPPPAPPGGWAPPNPGGGYRQPPVRQASLNPTQRFLAVVDGVANALLPNAMALVCVTCDFEGGGGYWDGGDIGQEPPLFPGDGPPATCMKAKKTQNCEGTWTGEECTINSEGEEVCVVVDPGTPPNDDCAALEEDPECTMIREECTDGAMASAGWCYVKSRLYECKRPVPGGGAPDPIIRNETECSSPSEAGITLPAICQDGSCTNDKVQTDEIGMGQPGAKMMLLQTVMNDYKKGTASAPPGDGGGGTQPPGDPVQASIGERAGDLLLSAVGISTANAQTVPSDPWAIPYNDDGGTDADPAAGIGGTDFGSFAGADIRFFRGQQRDCMKALGGLLNCCKKTPPQDQAPKLWDYMKKNLAKTNNAKGREEEADNGDSGFLSMIQGANQQDLQKMFTSNLDSLMGGGDGGDTNTDSSMEKSYTDFMKYEIEVEKPKLAWYCDNDEFELAVGKQTGTCTHLGSFCQTKILGKCIIKKDRYCCFNSPITRIIRENLDQSGVADLGSAKHPACQGLTIEQVMKMDMNYVDTNEIEGRMAQGGYNIDMAALSSMNFDDIQSMIDGAGSLVGDSTRVNPSDRTQSSVDQTDHSAAYGSIMGSQSGYRPTASVTAPTVGTIGLSWLERDITRGSWVKMLVNRSGSVGAAQVRIFTEDGTAVSGSDYVGNSSVLSWGDGQTGERSVVVQTNYASGSEPRENFKVKIEIVSGAVPITGNSEGTVWLKGTD